MKNFHAIVESCVKPNYYCEIKASVRLNTSLHIRLFTIITEVPSHVIDKRHTKHLKLENHFIRITDREMQHIAISQLYYPMPTRAANFVMYQHIINPSQDPISFYTVIILAESDSNSVQTYIPLTSGCNSH